MTNFEKLNLEQQRDEYEEENKARAKIRNKNRTFIDKVKGKGKIDYIDIAREEAIGENETRELQKQTQDNKTKIAEQENTIADLENKIKEQGRVAPDEKDSSSISENELASLKTKFSEKDKKDRYANYKAITEIFIEWDKNSSRGEKILSRFEFRKDGFRSIEAIYFPALERKLNCLNDDERAKIINTLIKASTESRETLNDASFLINLSEMIKKNIDNNMLDLTPLAKTVKRIADHIDIVEYGENNRAFVDGEGGLGSIDCYSVLKQRIVPILLEKGLVDDEVKEKILAYYSALDHTIEARDPNFHYTRN